ncbi:hypothetical protein BT69DRAFT_1292838 [Atractiella rhizophila]|nr:hypothetical protein BT69DRAFT_1292838 [Atractiella rhizophila]
MFTVAQGLAIGKVGKRQGLDDIDDSLDDADLDDLDLPPICPLECYASELIETLAAKACNVDDWKCLCENQDYLTNAINCSNTSCSQQDAQDGLVFGIQFCQAIGVNVNIPPSVTVTSGLVIPTQTGNPNNDDDDDGDDSDNDGDDNDGDD